MRLLQRESWAGRKNEGDEDQYVFADGLSECHPYVLWPLSSPETET